MIQGEEFNRRVVIVEDDNLTRTILAEHITKAGFLVKTASSASSAESVCADFDPDAVILDVDLGSGPTGFDLADSLLLSSPGIAILFLTHLPDSRFVGRSSQSLPAEVGYLNKNKLIDGTSLLHALEAVLLGKSGSAPRDDISPDRPLAQLSQSQLEVLRMIALGMSNQQIAASRNTSVRAVYSMISRAMAAIGEEEDAEGAGRVLAARAYMLAAGVPVGSHESKNA